MLIVGIAILHILALISSWYWLHPWLDLPQHFLGGLWVSLMGIYFYLRKKDLASIERRQIIKVALLTMLVIGAIVWKVFELRTGVAVIHSVAQYSTDVILDIVMGYLGSATAIWITLRFMKDNQSVSHGE